MRRAVLLAVLVILFVALVWPAADARYLGTDVMGNLSGSSGVGGLADKYPLSAYSLDSHVDVGIADLDGVPPTIAQWAATMLWMITTWVVKLVIDLFGWAFSLDLLSGPRGALGPVGDATRQIYDNVIGRTWLIIAFTIASFWAMWRGLIQRRYSEMYTGLAVSIICILVGWFFVFQPQDSIGQASKWSNDLSTGFLSATNRGNVTDGEQAKRQVSDHLFEVLVYRPWIVLEFGGLKHCVDTDRVDEHGYPRPVAPDDPARDVCRNHILARDGYGGYAPRFLDQPAGSDARTALYEALRDGTVPARRPVNPGPGRPPSGQFTYPSNLFDGWKVDKNDSPAVDIQQAGGAYQRLALALLISIGALGAILLLGFIALAIVLAQVMALVLLAFAPVALITGIFPGFGHRAFRWWLGCLGVAIFVKVIYSLMLGIIVLVSASLSDATNALPFGLAFGLQAGFFWGLLIYRKRLLRGFTSVATGHGTRTERVPARVRNVGERAMTAPFTTLASAASFRRDRHDERNTEKRTEHERTHEFPVDDDTTTGPKPTVKNKLPVDSSSPPASAGRTYSPPGPPPSDAITATNGHKSEEKIEMPGNRIPPRVDKTHIHSDGHQEKPPSGPVVTDPDRDTSMQPRVRIQTLQNWPDIASAHDEPPPSNGNQASRPFESHLP